MTNTKTTSIDVVCTIVHTMFMKLTVKVRRSEPYVTEDGQLSLEKTKMKKKLDGLDSIMIEHLKDPAFAAEYLREHWEYRGPDKLELLLQALHRIALARGMTEVSRQSGVSRRNLYKMFSENGNPSAKTLLVVMGALGVRMTIEQAKPRRKSAKR